MKEYIIRCNEDQLRLMRSALELQMRIRIGQGWAITDNLIEITDPEYRPIKDTYDHMLDIVLRRISINIDGTLKRPNTMIERDMWIGLENALGGARAGALPLSEYGPLKVEEVSG